jgi:hypothetical protein
LEASPVGRGGHLWIIFTDLVCAEIAQQCLLFLAPDLHVIREFWPRSTQKVRLPAGTYKKPGFAAWCTLTDAQDSILSTNGPAAAPVLLAYQTPVELLQEANGKQNQGGSGADFARTMHRQNTQRQERDDISLGQVDTRWQQRYNSSTLWFQFTPRQLAALFNERHPLQETLTLEQNGMAFSPSVPERTPSTAITGDGQAWVDFSARSMQPDGKHDGGDALELAARGNGESKAAKSNTLREVARMLVREARDALEIAARAGEEPPAWVAQIMTEAGWQRYHSLKTEAAKALAGTSTRGVVGYTSVGMIKPTTQEPFMRERTQQTATTQHISHERYQELNSLETLAAEIEAQIGEPCGQCGCTLFYQSGPYRMCHLCYPRPAKFGRLTDEQWQRLRSLIPSKPARIDHSRRRT